MSKNRENLSLLAIFLTVFIVSITIAVFLIIVFLFPKADNNLVVQRKIVPISSSSSFSLSSNLVHTSNEIMKNIPKRTGTLLGLGGIVDVINGGTGVNNLPLGFVLVGNGTAPVLTNKIAPVGAFVGTTDTQTLTNKTLGTGLNLANSLNLTGTTFTFNMPSLTLQFQNGLTSYLIFPTSIVMDIIPLVNLTQGVKLFFPISDVTYLAAPLSDFIEYNNPSTITVTAVSLGTTGTIRIAIKRYGTRIMWYFTNLSIALGASTTSELNVTGVISDLFCRTGTYGQSCLMNNNGSTAVGASVIIQNTGTGFSNVRFRFTNFTGNVSFLSTVSVQLSL